MGLTSHHIYAKPAVAAAGIDGLWTECKRTGAQTVDGLWSEFKRTGAQTLRNELIVYYSPFVKYVAGRVLAGLPRHFDEEDLVSYGIIGLIDAIERFDPARNLRFETYAIPRIKGAIIDELRAIDWVPRSVRTKARAVEHAHAHLESTLGRTPTESEVAAELEMTPAEFHKALRKISSVGIMALDEVLRVGDRTERSTLGETLPDRSRGPMDTFEAKESKEALAEAVDGMPDRERTVLTMYYYDGLTLTEIGGVLGVTESRVCQIHTKALRELRSKLADRAERALAGGPANRVPRRRHARRATETPRLELLAS